MNREHVAAAGGGFVAAPLVFFAALVISDELATGSSWECRQCGYCTGDRKTTRTIVARVRWQWHWTVGHLRGRR